MPERRLGVRIQVSGVIRKVEDVDATQRKYVFLMMGEGPRF